MQFERFFFSSPEKEKNESIKKFEEQYKEGSVPDVSFEAVDAINIDHAMALITKLENSFEREGHNTHEEDEAARLMVIELEKLQKLVPHSEEIKTALVKLRNVRHRSLEETT